jgi:gephyrin
VDIRADKSGPTILEILTQQGFTCRQPFVVPDDVSRIQDCVKQWCGQGDIDLLVTTGGTGFGVRDKTPEVSVNFIFMMVQSLKRIFTFGDYQAISPLLEREASGLVHLLLSSSLKHTPLAALSRPVAGTIKDTLIVTLPGSIKAVKENLQALLSGGVIQHAIELIRGGTGQQVHTALASSPTTTQSSHAHHHHHHHHDHDHHAPQPRTTLSHDPSAPGTSELNF